MTKFFICFVLSHTEPRFDVYGIGHTQEEAADACAKYQGYGNVGGYRKQLEEDSPGEGVWDNIATLEVTERVYRHLEERNGSDIVYLDEDEEPADFLRDDSRWNPIARIGRALYGDERWANKLAGDVGISTGLMTMMRTGERPITDKTLNRILEHLVRMRIDLFRKYTHIQTEARIIAQILGEDLTVDISVFDQDQDMLAGQFEAKMDQRVQQQVDEVLAVLAGAGRRAVAYPSIENLKALSAALDRHLGPEPDNESEIKP